MEREKRRKKVVLYLKLLLLITSERSKMKLRYRSPVTEQLLSSNTF